MQQITLPSREVPASEPNTARAEMEFAVFALEADLMEVMPASEGVYPFTMKTTYSSGSEATDN